SLDLASGPLLKAAMFTLGQGLAARLLLVAHHLVVDGVSWRVLLEDLAIAGRQLARGEAVVLPPRTSSFKRWAERLVEHARSAALLQEATLWQERLSRPVAPLPLDSADGRNDVASARTEVCSLDAEETRALLQEVPPVYRTRIDELLLAAVAQAVGSWTGHRRVLLDVENHGREEIFDDLSPARTVGWFTAIFPLLLDLEETVSPGEVLKTVKEQVRAVPGRGLGYGAALYLGSAEVKAALGAPACAEILFNYLGQIDQALPQDAPFRLGESVGPSRESSQPRSHLLGVEASIVGGRLQTSWTYSANRHASATIAGLAEACLAALRGLIAHCRNARAAGSSFFTPSDFPLAGLDQATLDSILALSGQPVEDIYPVSPPQHGLLFDVQLRSGAGLYIQQIGCELRGDLDPWALHSAWKRVVERHSILRTGFFWDRHERPLQVVRQRAAVPWSFCDLRQISVDAQQGEIFVYLDLDRHRGFDLSRPPLLRLTLFQLADDLYRLVWSHHHLLLDGWSLPPLLREVFALYMAARRGREVHLSPPRPYRDYVAWLGRQDLVQEEAFWRRLLKGFRSATPLPFAETTRVAAKGSSGFGQILGEIDGALTAEVAEVARRHRLTLNTILQGAWALLLARYSGHRDIVFGTVTSGRSAPVAGLEEILGVFINTLPVRVEVSDATPLSAWLEILQAQQVQTREHEYAPLAEIQGWSEMEGGLPLFQSLLVFENFPVGDALTEEAPEGLEVAGLEAQERSVFPLTLLATPGDRLHLKLMYERERLDGLAGARILQHLESVLRALSSRADRLLADLPLLSAAEHHQIAHEWNDTDRELVPYRLVHDWFADQVARTPDAIAVILAGETATGPGSLTYRELDLRSNQLARYLARLGVGTDVPVAIAMERSLEMMVGLLGILKVGGAYVPLDPSYPRERLSFMLEDALARVPAPVLLTQAHLVERLPRPESGALLSPITVIQLDTDWREVAAESHRPPVVDHDPGSLAYVLYTSGSTGQPKGVLISHLGLINYLAWAADAYEMAAGEGAPVHSPLASDLTVTSLLLPLLCGRRVWLLQEGMAGERLVEALRHERGFSVLKLTPTHLQILGQSLGGDDLAERARFLVVGGEALFAESLAPWRENAPATRIINEYGPTETVVGCCSYEANADGEAAGSVPIGRPIANTRLYVLDSHLLPVPAGVTGELFIGGRGVARGYLAQPDLTALRFIPDPWGAAGDRLYRTGDLVRSLSDGKLEFLGRSDQQVKIRGYRIELGEIEAALCRHPLIGTAAVDLHNPGSDASALVAYVVAREPGQMPEGVELRRFLAESLPEFMLPSTFVTLAELPLTPSGKLDRRALPEPDKPRRDGAGYVEPRSEIERSISELWRELLQIEQVGVHDNFFDLGGHSLLVLRMRGLVRRKLGRDVGLMELMKYPTIAALASHLGGQDEAQRTEVEQREGEHIQRLREGRDRLRRRSETRRDS
ncbi:MAG TPA: amino acid adenylation domain-containing protein, partial [Thermoanaerobaculia bacterium]|nr:amino acid adenylation domain-containing protein [Thermoanaerobaculia bacterium]